MHLVARKPEDRVYIECRGAPPWYVILDGNSIRRCLLEYEAIECRKHLIKSLQDTVDAAEWVVHSLHIGSGSALIGVATSLKHANALYKKMCKELALDEYFDPDDFVKTVKKVKEPNGMVIDLT